MARSPEEVAQNLHSRGDQPTPYHSDAVRREHGRIQEEHDRTHTYDGLRKSDTDTFIPGPWGDMGPKSLYVLGPVLVLLVFLTLKPWLTGIYNSITDTPAHLECLNKLGRLKQMAADAWIVPNKGKPMPLYSAATVKPSVVKQREVVGEMPPQKVVEPILVSRAVVTGWMSLNDKTLGTVLVSPQDFHLPSCSDAGEIE